VIRSAPVLQALRTRVRRVLVLPRTLRHRARHERGRCSVCGKASRFLAHSDNLKESLHCARCGAWMRVRMIADVLVATFSRAGAASVAELVHEREFRELAIHEAQASGPLHAMLCATPRYLCSEYLPGVEPGATRHGLRCEDLQATSFPAASLDLVLHSSVLEHVPHPDRALAESFRVLRAGGHLVFEVPMTDPGVRGLRPRSVKRVDASSGRDVHLLPPLHHDDPLRPEGALVYTDFGMDVVTRLSELGFDAHIESRELHGSTMSHATVVVARKPAEP
jgi:SAM-dependent methyltransferase